MTASQRAVFLDRDGVICALVDDPHTGQPEAPLHLDDVALLTGAASSIARLRQAGYLLIGVTNQPAAAKGFITLNEQHAIHERVLDLLAANGLILDDWRICPHHPDAVIKELQVPCDCRKPRPGMLLDAARAHHIDTTASWMIGDSDTDIEAGQLAQTRTALVGAVDTHKRRHPERATISGGDLDGVITMILAATAPTEGGSMR